MARRISTEEVTAVVSSRDILVDESERKIKNS